ncbi:MAG TPA: hypothetical protein VH724_11750 [Candidatus Angelobacter sp.]|nr:hypothetical protein [Candidatus Angelobacter sp.]
MTKNRRPFAFAAVLMMAVLFAPARNAFAQDDFGKIVQHIEANYHVHRQHRWVMGLAGFTVKFWHFAGVKSLKGAIFENQPFVNAASDTRFDEIVRAAMDSGWQPMVQSWDRHSGERTYIYAQDVSSKKGKDLKLLVVNLEANEAVVLQVKVDPKKLNEFIQDASWGRNHHSHRAMPPDETPTTMTEAMAAAASSAPAWDGMCLFLQEEYRPVGEL